MPDIFKRRKKSSISQRSDTISVEAIFLKCEFPQLYQSGSLFTIFFWNLRFNGKIHFVLLCGMDAPFSNADVKLVPVCDALHTGQQTLEIKGYSNDLSTSC